MDLTDAFRRPGRTGCCYLLELAEAGRHEALASELEDLRNGLPGARQTMHSGRSAWHCGARPCLGGTGGPRPGCRVAGRFRVAGPRDGVFFFNEYVLGRLITDYLAMGEWESAERELANYSTEHAQAAATFGGSRAAPQRIFTAAAGPD